VAAADPPLAFAKRRHQALVGQDVEQPRDATAALDQQANRGRLEQRFTLITGNRQAFMQVAPGIADIQRAQAT
jgi:hypothetical protein